MSESLNDSGYLRQHKSGYCVSLYVSSSNSGKLVIIHKHFLVLKDKINKK